MKHWLDALSAWLNKPRAVPMTNGDLLLNNMLVIFMYAVIMWATA